MNQERVSYVYITVQMSLNESAYALVCRQCLPNKKKIACRQNFT